jgi:hypothetical protein
MEPQIGVGTEWAKRIIEWSYLEEPPHGWSWAFVRTLRGGRGGGSGGGGCCLRLRPTRVRVEGGSGHQGQVATERKSSKQISEAEAAGGPRGKRFSGTFSCLGQVHVRTNPTGRAKSRSLNRFVRSRLSERGWSSSPHVV